MWTVCLFYSQNNKIMIIKHGRHTRCAKVCGLFFFVIVLFGWLLAGQTNSDHMGALALVRACVIMSKNKKFFLSAEIHRKVSILCEQSAVTAPAVIFAVRRVNQPFEMSALLVNVLSLVPVHSKLWVLDVGRILSIHKAVLFLLKQHAIQYLFDCQIRRQESHYKRITPFKSSWGIHEIRAELIPLILKWKIPKDSRTAIFTTQPHLLLHLAPSNQYVCQSYILSRPIFSIDFRLLLMKTQHNN